MNVFTKDPTAVVKYTHDWAENYLGQDETLSASAWSVTPSGLDVDESTHSSGQASVTLSGGIAGILYRVSNAITTSENRAEERAIAIRVQQR